jgi:HEAT repeat protein
MITASGRRIMLVIFCLAAGSLAGCADLDILPSWVPFQGPASDQLPGVKTPAERISDLQKLSEGAAKSTAEEKKQISEQLAASIRTEKDPLIRLEIIRALGGYPGPAADAILKAALADADIQVRVAACEAWGKHGGSEAVTLLAEALRSDVNADVRLAAAKALGETKSPQSVSALGDALADSDPAMQYRAVLSLKKVTGKDLGDDVERWRQYVKGGPPEQPPTFAERVRNWF